MHPALFTTPGVRQFAEDVDAERQRQIQKFGEQHHPDGTGPDRVWAFTGPASFVAEIARDTVDALAEEGEGYVSWLDIALEEFAEAAAESDPAKLRAELVQVAAVCAAWIADIDSRSAAEEQPAPAGQAPAPLPPELVSSILRDENSPYFPSQITVFCDHCGTEDTSDYMVREDMTREERLGVARKHLASTKGWEHDADGDDFCPEHASTSAAPGACGKCKTPFDPTDTRHDGHARHSLTDFCRRCVDSCHESTGFAHSCVICA